MAIVEMRNRYGDITAICDESERRLVQKYGKEMLASAIRTERKYRKAQSALGKQIMWYRKGKGKV